MHRNSHVFSGLRFPAPSRRNARGVPDSARARMLNMLPTVAKALSAAQFACVFENIFEFVMNQIWGHESDQPNHLPQPPSPIGGLTHREPWPSGLTGNKADTLDVLHFVPYAI